MTQKNNKNTDREKELFAMDTTLPLITPQQTPDQSSNYLPLIMAGAGLIGYTFYHKYTKHCSLDGKTAIFSSQWIESTDPNVPGNVDLEPCVF